MIRSLLTPALLALLVSLAPRPASALIMTGRGNSPVRDPGWPEGALAMANLKCRVGWWEGPPFGGGQWQFQYRGDTEMFSQALTNFAAIRAPQLDLVIHDGPQEGQFLKEKDQPASEARVDWSFTVWVPANWHRLFNNPKSVFSADHPNFRQPVDPPRLDIYVGGGGTVDWAKVKVPANLRLRDERAAAAGIKVEGGAMIRADIYDMASGKPVPGARLIVASRPGGQSKPYEKVAEGTTDEAGRVEVRKIPADTYQICARADNFASRIIGYEQMQSNAFKSFTIELTKAESLRGQVLDGSSQPIKGAQVRASSAMAMNGRGYNSPEPREATTGEDGRFELNGLPYGYTQLWTHAPGYHFSDQFTIYNVPTTNILLRMARGGAMRITVTDSTGHPMATYSEGRVDGQGRPETAQIMVKVEPKGGDRIGSWGASGNVKEDGTIEFTEVPVGEYRITSMPNPGSTARQYAPAQMIKIEPGKRLDVTIKYE